jgi:hypothetical protein
MTTDTARGVHVEDVVGVSSRVSWGALLAGAVLAVACSMILTLFFTAVGLSLSDADVRAETLGVGAVVAAVVTIVLSMFFGGWATSQLTAGETLREAALYGVLTWAVVMVFSLGMIGANVRTGYFALMGSTFIVQTAPAAQQNQVRVEAADPAARERAQHAAVAASWGALVGMLLSAGAAIGGAVAGSGPAFRLFPVVHATRQEIIIAR